MEFAFHAFQDDQEPLTLQQHSGLVDCVAISKEHGLYILRHQGEFTGQALILRLVELRDQGHAFRLAVGGGLGEGG